VRGSPKGWKVIAAGATLAAVAVTAFYLFFRLRYRTAAELVGLLPQSSAVVVYVDLNALRTTGLLKRFNESLATQEAEYRKFVSSTGFLYERDLDALAVSSFPDQTFGVARGRFDWKRLRDYATVNGGSCQESLCQVPGSKPDRRLSFLRIRSNLMALAISADASAAYDLRPGTARDHFQTPDYPAWIRVPKRLLDNPKSLPPPVQVIAVALSGASNIILGFRSDTPQRDAGGLLLRMDASFDSAVHASLARNHMAQLVGLFKSMANSQSADPESADLSRALSSGSFLSNDSELEGAWHIPGSLIDSLLR
jgi:hypothetical protein